MKEELSEQLIWGNYVHKQFELRQTPCGSDQLPPDLQVHEPFMQELEQEQKAGACLVEQRIALNRHLKPCTFFAKDVWYRGVIDWSTVFEDKTARVVDYKTGKPHTKHKQLMLFALHTFATYTEVELVQTQYYWTQTKTTTEQIYYRDDVSKLWGQFIPDLRQYAEAFETDTWQPRPSGLCHGWCPVTTCEFWRPKRTT